MSRRVDKPPVPPSPSRSDSRAIVEAIVEATKELLAKGDCTMNSIARRAGVGVASLYRYFPDKAALITEVFRRQHWVLEESILAHLDHQTNLEGVVKSCVHSFLRIEQEVSLRRTLYFDIPIAWTLDIMTATTQRMLESFAIKVADFLPDVPSAEIRQRVFHSMSIARGMGQLRILLPDIAPDQRQLEANAIALITLVMKGQTGVTPAPSQLGNRHQ